MYKIAQNFPVIVKQPLFLKSTNLLKSQGSLFLCTKVKLHENANEFETEVSKSDTRVSNKKEPASSNNPTTLSNETISAFESSKIATPTASIKKSATGAASSRILANTTTLNKNFTASIDPFSKTIPIVSPIEKPTPIEKQIPIATLANKTINLTPPSKTESPEAPLSQQHTNTLKLSPPPQDVLSQNTIKPTTSGGVQFQIPGRLLIAFTCKKCNTRNSKKISKHAYTKGVVIIRCDGCKNNHLIADNLNWFSDMGKKRNIEDIMAEKGEKVTKIVLPGGISEFLTDS